jgi:hypothetical protein
MRSRTAPKLGRPPDVGTARTAIIPAIRCTPDERKRMVEAARRAGLGLGPWLRMLGMREAGQRP